MITVCIVEAVTQADCVICYHAMRNGDDGALANDGDFIAVAGKKMMLIKDFKIKRGWKRTNKSHVDALGSIIVAVGYRDIFHSDIVGKLISLRMTFDYPLDLNMPNIPCLSMIREMQKSVPPL